MIDYVTYIGAIAGIFAALFGFILWRSERNHEISRLKSLMMHLNFIKESAKGHEKHVKSKNLPFPSWSIANIDLNFYLTNIKSQVRKERCFYHISTNRLKKELIAIYEKINNINFLWRRELDKPNSSDLKINTYYSDLYNFIGKSQIQIQRIIK